LWAVADYAARTRPVVPTRLCEFAFPDLPDVAFVTRVPDSAIVRLAADAVGFDTAAAVLDGKSTVASVVVNRKAHAFFQCSPSMLRALRHGMTAAGLLEAVAEEGTYPAADTLVVALARHGLVELSTSIVGDARGCILEPTAELVELDGRHYAVNLLSGRTIGLGAKLAELIGTLRDTGGEAAEQHRRLAAVHTLCRAGLMRRVA
jgi:hypothetical protein